MIVNFQGKPYQIGRPQVETRSSAWDQIVDLYVRQARGESVTDVFSLSLVQAAIGLWRHAFASAAPSTAENVLNPQFLANLISQLLVKGEAAYEISVSDSGIKLNQAATWSVSGETPDPDDWVYKTTINAPDKSIERNLPRERVLHIQWDSKPSAPWEGVGPLEDAFTSSQLASVVQSKLLDEVSGMPVGGLLPVSGDPNSEKFAPFKQALKSLRGKLAPVESKTSSYSAPGQPSPNAANEFMVRRIGANPPDSLTKLCDLELNLVSCLQVPRELVLGRSDGTALRESWRRFTIVIKSVGRSVAFQLARDLDLPGLTMDWDALAGPDIAQRARAFSSLVKGGMAIEEAREYALVA